MTFNEFQEKAFETAIYPNKGENIVYPTLGLCGESGEVAEKVKKLLRDSNGIMTVEFTSNLSKELGDVMWYLAAICTELGLSMEYIASLNIRKLQDRKQANTLHGSGDNR
jgi:NTP pyrophosphatase (non-canonical NTP hydrolase)